MSLQFMQTYFTSLTVFLNWTCSAETTRLKNQLMHFFKPVSPSPGDEGDDTIEHDCWENRDPDKMVGWSLMNIPCTGRLVFAGIYTGPVVDGQFFDENTKVTDVTSVSRQVVKVTSSATQGPDPYHFCILVNVVDYPFDLGQLIGSLMPNNWTSLTTRLENELGEGA